MQRLLRGLGGRWVVIVILIALGGGAVFGGYLITDDHDSYFSSALLEGGVALFLLAPLLFVEHLIEKRVDAARADAKKDVEEVGRDVGTLREEVDRTSERIGELADEMSDRLDRRREQDAELVEAAVEVASWENIAELLGRAEGLGAISRRGVRVRLGGVFKWIHFRLAQTVPPDGGDAERMIWLSMQDAKGKDVAVVAIWSPEEAPTEPMLRLIEAWQQHGDYLAGALDPDQVFGGLIDALNLAIESRTGTRHAEPLDPLVEKVNEKWAFTDLGLEHLGFPEYPIEGERILRDPAALRRDMLEKTWVSEDAEAFREAVRAYEMFHE